MQSLRCLLLLVLVACGDKDGERPLDSGSPEDSGPTDADGDGFAASEDCDDSDPTSFPGAEELCDEVDHDCDGGVDEGLRQTWYVDADGDGVGDADALREACAQPSGTSAQAGDCDDSDPDHTEEMQWFIDIDEDGYGYGYGALGCGPPDDDVFTWVPVGGDCGDANPAVNPGEVEVCDDGLDNDCDEVTEVCEMNLDGLDYAPCSPYAPHDVEGARWSWEDTNQSYIWAWTVENLGAGTYEGVEVWRVQIDGSARNGDGSYWRFFDVELGVSCESDGVHLVYEDRRDGTAAHRSSWSERFVQISSRPLWVPATLTRGDTWRIEDFDLPSKPSNPFLGEPGAWTAFEVGGSTTLPIGDETLEVVRVNMEDERGVSSSWWLHEGVGLVRVYLAESFRAEATSSSGL